MPTGNLPASGKKVFEKVYQSALKGSCKGDKECAARTAWSAVKGAGWHKKDGKWMKKSDAMQEFSMYITRANIDEKGVMRWSAVNSDTDPDSYEERMSVGLYEDFIGHIRRGENIPDIFKNVACSDYWCGGMPYLSVSHYPDLNGAAVPGEPEKLFVDGNNEKARLKASGYLFDSPLGHSVFRSLKEDKVKSPDEKIRISIGFLDLAHRHGNGEMWVRDSLYSLCPDCLEGVGDKVYMKGYLVHLALTRVPVNKRTEMVLEEKSEMTTKGKKTRKDDAASIIGKDLAEEIDAKNKVSALKSDVLVEMSESEEPTPEETQELVEEVSNIADDEDRTEAEEATEQELVLDSTTATLTVDANGKPVAEKMEYNLPYGGATSMKDAKKAQEAKEEMAHVMDLWSMFSNVAWNIMDTESIMDKKSAFVKALDEFKSMLATKAMLEFGMTERSLVEKSEEPQHGLQPALDALLDTIDNSVELAVDYTQKLEAINPAMQEFGKAITDYVTQKSAVETPAPDKNNDNLLENIKQLIQPITESVQTLSEKVGILEAKSNAQNVEVRQTRIPQPRTVQVKPVLKAESEKPKAGSLRDIINKSVGLS